MTAVNDKKPKLNRVALVLAVAHFLLSFLTDRLIFDYVLFDVSTAKNLFRTVETFGVKAVFLIVLIFLWQGGFWMVKNANPTFLKIAAGYMALMGVCLLLTWPGVWRMDEFGILSSSVQLFPHFWQNYITSVFYVLTLMLLPFPAGVVIVQCVCISFIVARLVSLCLEGQNKSETRFGRIILILPFLLFPVLDSNLYPIRMSLYAFLEVLLIAELYFVLIAESRETGKWYWVYLTALASVVTVWRTEAIYYVVAYPVILLFAGKGRKYVKQALAYIIMFVILFAPQKLGEKISSGQQYELTSVVLPLVPLVQEAAQNTGNKDMELLAIIDEVVDVEMILKGASEGKSGINLFWGEPEFQRQYSSEQFAQFKSAYYQLIVMYPGVFMKERLQTFLDSSDLLENTTEVFTRDGVPNYAAFKKYPLNKPLNNNLRTSVIKILELRDVHDYQKKLPVTDWVYSAIPAVLILLIAALVLLCKRRWMRLLLVLTVLVKVPLVFLTAPSRLFMYYYSVYLFGYCVLFYFLYRGYEKFCDRRKVGMSDGSNQ